MDNITKLENVNNRSYHGSGSGHSGQVPSTGQQPYPSCFQRGNGGNGDTGSNGPPGNDGHCLHRSGSGCGDPHDAPGCPSDDTYGAGSDRFSSLEFGRWHRYD